MKNWKKRLSRLKLPSKLRSKLPHLSRKHWLMVGLGACSVAALFVLWSLFAPQTIQYNYGAETTCSSSPRLFSSLSSITPNNTFQIHRPASASIGKIALYSSKVCAKALAPPEAKKSSISRERLFGIAFLSRKIIVKAPEYPALANPKIETQMLAPDAPLILDLAGADKTFTYKMISKERSAPCTNEQQKISCNVAPLGLAYAQLYEVSVIRMYGDKQLSAIATLQIQTITPTVITESSIAPGSTVQDKPAQIIVKTDKQLNELGDVQLVTRQADGKELSIPVTATFASNQITVQIKEELPRKMQFELRVASLKATDSSGLATKSFVLPFTTSGGPKVKSASIGSRNVALNPTISLTFDQPLLPSQPIAKNVVIAVNGAAVAASVTIVGDKVHIKPSGALPLCAPFSVTIDAAVQSQFGITGDSAWSIKSRAICYTTFSIGSSVRGRAITAYRFGSGPEMIIYLGAMHGNEGNSRSIMNEWFADLNASPERIPANRSIVIIPALNPDGIAAGTRFNARGVDLNRNFPANDWKSVVTTPDSSQPTAAGGPSPLSEPESQALASFIRQNAPRLVMSFHSKATIVEANEGADSVGIASTYAAKSRYRAVPKSQSAPVFKYDTTGAMEDWMRDKLGRAAIVVELASDSSSEFGRNRDALWYTVGL
ncbi:MAG: DUF2817 domain-containing protein [Candidatus Saccharimonadales bacterium]